jgi:hypothetical protein
MIKAINQLDAFECEKKGNSDESSTKAKAKYEYK